MHSLGRAQSPRVIRGAITLAVVLAALAALACGERASRSGGEASDAARIRAAIEAGDLPAARAAARDLDLAPTDDAELLLERAELLVRAGEAPRALWVLEDGVARVPDDARVQLALANVALGLGDPSRALEAALAVAPAHDLHADALLVRAQAEMALGDLDRGLATLAEMADQHPDRPESRLFAIATLLKEDRQDEAVALAHETRASLGEGETADAGRRSIDLLLAQVRAKEGDLPGATEAARALVLAQPGDPAGWELFARLLLAQKETEQLLQLVDEVSAEPDAPAFLAGVRARALIVLGRDDEAEAVITELAAQAEHPAGVLPLVEWHLARDAEQAADAALDDAIARFPQDAKLRAVAVEIALAQENAPQARERLRDLRAQAGPSPMVDYHAARLQLLEGDEQGAADALMALAPRYDVAATQYWIGVALERLGDLEGARRRYGLALRRDPRWLPPSHALMRLARERGDTDELGAVALRVVRANPDDLGGHLGLAEALRAAGDPGAVPHAERLVERFPEETLAHLALASARTGAGDVEGALATLDAAEAQLGPSAAIAEQRARALTRSGRAAEALAGVDAALERWPGDARLHATRAAVLFTLGRGAEGIAATDEALAQDPDAPAPLRERCAWRVAASSAGATSPETAVADCRRYLGIRPADGEIWLLLGLALESTGDPAGATEAYREATRLVPRNPHAHNNLALLLAEAGDLEAALASAQEAHRLAEADPNVLDTLGELYRRSGLVERAISFLEEAREAAPGSDAVRLHLALAYRDAGRPAEARELLDGLAQGPKATAAREALDSLPEQ